MLALEESLHWALQGRRLGRCWPVGTVHELPGVCLSPFWPEPEQGRRRTERWGLSPGDGVSLPSRARLADALSRFILVLPGGAEPRRHAAGGARMSRGAEGVWKSKERGAVYPGGLPSSFQLEARPSLSCFFYMGMAQQTGEL